MKSIFSKAKIGSQPGARPPAAVEIAPEGVLAAALPGPVYAFAPLAEGALLPGIGEPNIRNAESVAAAIRTALGQVSPRTRSVALLLPDTVVRVLILDFDSLPAKTSEAIEVLRFRLRKMLPFEVEHAGVSYQILFEDKTTCKVLTAVMPGAILAEYEAAVRAAGYEPGAVLPSSLAALELVDSMEASLAVNLSSLALTTFITNGSNLLLYRTLDLPADPALHVSEIQRDIAVAAAFFEDKLGARPRRLYYSGSTEMAEFASWMENSDMTVVDLASRPETGAATALGNTNIAGVAGALAGAR